MNREQTWKNFDLGTEIDVAGTFIYNGVRCFHEMQTLDHADEVFEFLYNVSVGLERLLKVAVILLEHDKIENQDQFKKSLITHVHLDLINRVKKHVTLQLATPHNDFLSMLGTFYKSFRYDRFNLSGNWQPDKEKAALRGYIEKHLLVILEPTTSIIPTKNTANFRRHIGKVVGKISSQIFEVVRKAAQDLNIYTYELRSESKAAKIFLKSECDFNLEDVLWKELLVFFMNSKANTKLFDFLRSIEPLDFDPGLAPEYLQCFQSEKAKMSIVDELEEHYLNVKNKRERFEMIDLIGNPMAYLDDNEDDIET